MKGQTREEGFGKALRELSSKLDKEVTFTLMCPEPAGSRRRGSRSQCRAVQRAQTNILYKKGRPYKHEISRARRVRRQNRL